MANFNFEEMQKIQKELQEKYKDKWTPICPKTAGQKLLYLFIEAGEMADILKKQGAEKIMEDPKVRKHFVEEMCDTMMYFNDIMLCFDISPEELETEYRNKHQKNMTRW